MLLTNEVHGYFKSIKKFFLTGSRIYHSTLSFSYISIPFNCITCFKVLPGAVLRMENYISLQTVRCAVLQDDLSRKSGTSLFSQFLCSSIRKDEC